MKTLIMLALVALIVTPSLALDLGAQRPVKPVVQQPQNVPSDLRQGGDTIADATVVTLPLVDMTGTTAGYTDDYDEVCPYSGSTSPDVVYTFTPNVDEALAVDLCGSAYDTKVYVYDGDLNLVACNDDFYFDDGCGVYVSKIEGLTVTAGVTYYVVIDGYGGAFGDYVLNIGPDWECFLDCPVGAELEGEPPLGDGYVDEYNSGCGGFTTPLGSITQEVFCGVSGWYASPGGLEYRDTDWFELMVPPVGYVEIIGDAEEPTFLFELAPPDCAAVGVVQDVIVGSCIEGVITIPGDVGSTVWFWVGPTTFSGPVVEYDYILFTNFVVATEGHSWTDVKGLFD